MNKLLIILLFTLLQSITFASELQYSFYLPNESKNILMDDFSNLEKISFSSAQENAKLNQILKLETLTHSSLKGWINTRVSYIVEEEFNNDDQDIFINEDEESYNHSSDTTFMTNYGAAVFQAAQNQALIAGFHFTNQENITSNILIRSPRIGLLKIGAGLFNPEYSISRDKTAHANSINRLSIIAHEARHSDGNGKSLGFRHQKCPTGHYLSGVTACDFATNGAYSISSLLLKEFTKVCELNCSITEKQTLLMTILDNASRVIKNGDNDETWDETPYEKGEDHD